MHYQWGITFHSALCSCGSALYATMLEVVADTMTAHRGYNREILQAARTRDGYRHRSALGAGWSGCGRDR